MQDEQARYVGRCGGGGARVGAIAAAVSYSEATDKATLNPTKALRKGATYKAVVTTGAKDVAGSPLDQNTAKAGLQQKRWVFTVKKK